MPSRRPQVKTLKTHYNVLIKLVFGVTSQWPTYCSYTVFGAGDPQTPPQFLLELPGEPHAFVLRLG